MFSIKQKHNSLKPWDYIIVTRRNDYMILENADLDVREYFNSMPTAIKEMIMQDGVEIKSVEQLKAIEENFKK